MSNLTPENSWKIILCVFCFLSYQVFVYLIPNQNQNTNYFKEGLILSVLKNCISNILLHWFKELIFKTNLQGFFIEKCVGEKSYQTLSSFIVCLIKCIFVW